MYYTYYYYITSSLLKTGVGVCINTNNTCMLAAWHSARLARAYREDGAPATIRANSSFLESRHHGILSVPILPFWGQDIMAYLSVPILPSWGQDITAYLSVPIPPLKRLCNYMCRVVLLYYFSASRVLCIIRIIIY